MSGYALVLCLTERDDQTGEEWDGDVVDLHLSYDLASDAERAASILRPLYGQGARVEICALTARGSYQPGESP